MIIFVRLFRYRTFFKKMHISAIKNMSDYYYLNGNYQIQVIDKDLEIGGTIFEYDNHKSRGGDPFEKLIAKGPINEELTIALLFQSGNKVNRIVFYYFDISVLSNNVAPRFK